MNHTELHNSLLLFRIELNSNNNDTIFCFIQYRVRKHELTKDKQNKKSNFL